MYAPAHTFSKKSARQQRNVFIWSSYMNKITMGWRVDADSPTSISKAYRWITTLIKNKDPNSTEPFTLFPVVVRPSNVLTYAIQRSGLALSRESQENILPGDYGIYNEDGSNTSFPFSFSTELSYADCGFPSDDYCALAKKASLPSTIAERALARDKGCIFTGSNSDNLVATWIFPPYLGYTLSSDPWLSIKYHDNPEACDLSEFTVVTNTVSGCGDLVTLFFQNKLGIDVDDNYRIVIFDRSGLVLKGATSLKSHVTFVDGHDRPSDRFLRLHFQHCIATSACAGNATEDYKDQEIDLFMEELGVYDNEMDTSDPRWTTPLGIEVYAYLVRQKMRLHGLGVEEDLSEFPRC